MRGINLALCWCSIIAHLHHGFNHWASARSSASAWALLQASVMVVEQWLGSSSTGLRQGCARGEQEAPFFLTLSLPCSISFTALPALVGLQLSIVLLHGRLLWHPHQQPGNAQQWRLLRDCSKAASAIAMHGMPAPSQYRILSPTEILPMSDQYCFVGCCGLLEETAVSKVPTEVQMDQYYWLIEVQVHSGNHLWLQ